MARAFAARGISTSTFVPSLNVSVASSGEPFSLRDTTARAVWVVAPFVHVAVARAAERPKRLILPPEKVAVHTEPSGSVAEKLPTPDFEARPRALDGEGGLGLAEGGIDERKRRPAGPPSAASMTAAAADRDRRLRVGCFFLACDAGDLLARTACGYPG